MTQNQYNAEIIKTFQSKFVEVYGEHAWKYKIPNLPLEYTQKIQGFRSAGVHYLQDFFENIATLTNLVHIEVCLLNSEIQAFTIP